MARRAELVEIPIFQILANIGGVNVGNTLRTLAVWLSALIVILSGMALGFVGAAAPVVARGAQSSDTTGYAITIIADSTDIQYQGSDRITATLTYPASNPPSYFELQYTFAINGQSYTASYVTSTTTSVKFGVSLPSQFLPGQYTVIGIYTEPSTNIKVSSAPLTITVEKISGNVSCGVPDASVTPTPLNVNGFFKPGQTMNVQMFPPLFEGQGGTDPVINWANTSVTITFSGPTTSVTPTITPDSNGKFSVSVPTQIGAYQVECAFSGDTNYAAETSTFSITVSEEHALGSVQLFSNPTSLNVSSTQPFTLYIVFHAAPGLPIPTGGVNYVFLRGSTNVQALNSDGALLAKLYPAVPPAGGIQVDYMGDKYYAPTILNFSTTNPPIPGNANNGSNANPNGGATATPNPYPTGTVTETTTPTATSTGAATGASDATPNAPFPALQVNWALIIGLIMALIALGGGIGGFFLYRARRARRAFPELAESTPTTQPPYGQQWGGQQWGERTWRDSTQPQQPVNPYYPPSDQNRK